MFSYTDNDGWYFSVSRGWAKCVLTTRDIQIIEGRNVHGSKVIRISEVTNPFTDKLRTSMESSEFYPEDEYPPRVAWSDFFEAVRDLIYLVDPEEDESGAPYGSVE
jgi:hypothetical protein